MIYFIERETDMPFDESFAVCRIDDKTYDLIKRPKDVGLERISDHIIDDGQLGMIFEKTNPREQKKIEAFIENRWGPMAELLLG